MEAFLHYVWLRRLYSELIPTGRLAGAKIEVIDPGELNRNAGPDFFLSKVKINGLLWVGSVEIHHASSEWFTHHHDEDPAYHSVILHVVELDNREVSLPSGEGMPTCLLMVPDALRPEATNLVSSSNKLPCAGGGKGGKNPTFSGVELEAKDVWLHCLLHARLREKTRAFQDLLLRASGNWNQAFYTLLLRYFGFGLNAEAMERLAFALPYATLMKHRDHPDQVEALLLGQAGLLSVLPLGDYTEHLVEEYTFLRHKYSLSPLPEGMFQRARTRPANLPERRLVQLATLLSTSDFLPDRFLHLTTPEEACALLQHPLSEAWAAWDKGQGGCLSRKACDLLLINVLVPYRLAYRLRYGALHSFAPSAKSLPSASSSSLSAVTRFSSSSQEGAPHPYSAGSPSHEDPTDTYPELMLLQGISAEDNRIVRLFADAGLRVKTAAESQALLHLHRFYCAKGLCSACPFSHLG